MTTPPPPPPHPRRNDAAAAATVAPAAGPHLDPDRWVDEHGDYLYHYALSRLRDPSRAEDFVQEALLAGLRSQTRFEGRSSERSWLTGILKNKLLDYFRKAGRETSLTDLNFYADEEDRTFDDAHFAQHWNADRAPTEWSSAGEPLDREAFWNAFNQCSDKLPPKIARVFLMREVDQLPGEEICATLNISQNNLWVMLHRARLALRRCLEVSWFGNRPGAPREG